MILKYIPFADADQISDNICLFTKNIFQCEQKQRIVEIAHSNVLSMLQLNMCFFNYVIVNLGEEIHIKQAPHYLEIYYFGFEYQRKFQKCFVTAICKIERSMITTDFTS